MSAASPFERPGARERQRQETRARLFEAAQAEFARSGFDRASVSEIARAAGVSRPSFYFHFPTKEHVLLELQWQLELALVERLRPCETLSEMLGLLPDALLDVFESIDGELARDMLRIYARRPAGVPIDEQPYPVVREVTRHFVAGAVRGELRAGLDPARAALLCLSSVFGYLMGAPSDGERRRDVSEIVRLYLEAPPEPHEARGRG